jgi:hypothetical protein
MTAYVHKTTGEIVSARRLDSGVWSGSWEVLTSNNKQRLLGDDLFNKTYERRRTE